MRNTKPDGAASRRAGATSQTVRGRLVGGRQIEKVPGACFGERVWCAYFVRPGARMIVHGAAWEQSVPRPWSIVDRRGRISSTRCAWSIVTSKSFEGSGVASASSEEMLICGSRGCGGSGSRRSVFGTLLACKNSRAFCRSESHALLQPAVFSSARRAYAAGSRGSTNARTIRGSQWSQPRREAQCRACTDHATNARALTEPALIPIKTATQVNAKPKCPRSRRS